MGVVYKITNKVNGKAYVGKTIGTLGRRWGQHKDYAKHHSRIDTYLYRAMRKHGCDNFTIEVLDMALLDEELCQKEMEWIAKLKTTDRNIGYNGTFGGQSGIPTPETRKKMMGRPCSPETRRKIGDAHRGKVMSEEARRKMIASKLASEWRPSPEQRMKMGSSRRGKKSPPDVQKKMTEGIKKAWTPERRAKFSQMRKEECAKNPLPAPVLTPEGRARVTEATRQRYAAMTLGQRKALAAPRLELAREALKNPELIKRRNQSIKAAWTQEKRAAWAEKMRPRLIEQNRLRSIAAQERRLA